MRRIILASVSPRRAELLEMLVDEFVAIDSGVSEECSIHDPKRLVAKLAQRKAGKVFQDNRDAVVIGADTVVAINGKILGKPKDEADAREMIGALAGRTHAVYTGVCVMAGEMNRTIVCRTEVVMSSMTPAEIDEYILQRDWTDKAGAYGIQGAAARHITGICGCYYNVMGLPVNALYKILKEIR